MQAAMVAKIFPYLTFATSCLIAKLSNALLINK